MASSLLGNRPVKTALHQAVIDGRLKQVRLLVGRSGSNIDAKDVYGRTPLMLACLLDNETYGIRMVKILLDAGANCNISDKLGRTALSYVCLKGREAILKKLLKEDILDFNAPDNDGNPPINLASMSGNPAVVRTLLGVLLKFGISVDYRNLLGYTALLLATKYGHYVSAHVLLTEGSASPLLRDNELFLNAGEWARRSHHLHAQYVKATSTVGPQRHLSASAGPFVRESTMYDRLHTARVHTCHHVKTQPDPFGTYIHLPAIFRSQNDGSMLYNEAFLNNTDARQLLLDRIEDTTKNRPSSGASSSYSRISHPSSVKLMALTPRSRTVKMVSDLEMLFKIYSDQYPEMLRKQQLTSGKQGEPQVITMQLPSSNAFLSVRKSSEVTSRKSISVAD